MMPNKSKCKCSGNTAHCAGSSDERRSGQRSGASDLRERLKRMCLYGVLRTIPELTEREMADEVDMANDSVERALEHALKQIRSAPAMAPKGFCYFCEEPLEPAEENGELVHRRLFCDRDCADDWEREQRARRLR